MEKIGFIKGGQLAKMMLEAAAGFDIHSFVLDNDPQCPCRWLCHEFVLGDCLAFDDVYSFGKKVDLLTFEYEHINAQALKKLQAEGLAIYPDPRILEMVQDKGRQKEFFIAHQIPTAQFRLIGNRQALTAAADFFPAVQKTRTAGYDGRGVYKVHSTADIPGAFDGPSVLERCIDFDKEIAVLVARNVKGETAVYPTVEMVFHPVKNLVEFLASPANITEEVDQRARQIAAKIASELHVVGILAVEMFVTKTGEVLVNEIAPRVHNSGHHTIEGNHTSQFKQHLRAIMGLPLGPTGTKAPAVMVNILGSEGCVGKARYSGIEAAQALGGVHIHLYGKEITKPFRKMGHATVIDHDIAAALNKARQVKELIQVQV